MPEAWAAKYSTGTLREALGMAYAQMNDPYHMYDVAWHEAQGVRIQQITAALTEEKRRCAVTALPTTA